MKILRGAALVAVALWACTACGGAGGAKASIGTDQLVGVWSSSSGVRVTLTADHHARAQGLEHTDASDSCGGSITDGTWNFMVPVKDGSAESETATHGEEIGIGTKKGACVVFGDVHRDKGYDLCLYADPDGGTCSDGELLRKEHP